MRQIPKFKPFLRIFLLIISVQLVYCEIQFSASENVFPITDDSSLQQFFDDDSVIMEDISKKNLGEKSKPSFPRYNKDMILDNTLKKLANIKNHFLKSFPSCSMKRGCDRKTRDSQFDDFLNPGRSAYANVIHDYIVKNDTRDNDERFFEVLQQISDYRVEKDEDCNFNRSVQNLIYDLYSHITDVNMKIFSKIMLAHVTKSNDPSTSSMDRKKLYESSEDVLKEFKNYGYLINSAARNIIAKSPREIRSCDPPKHERGRTWERLRNFIQTFVISGFFLKGEEERRTCSIQRETHIDKKLTENRGIPNYLLTSERLLNCTKSDVDAIFIDLNDHERIYHHLRIQRNFESSYYGKSESASKNVKWDRSQILYPDQDIVLGYNSNPIGQRYPICLCQIDRVNADNTLRRISMAAVLANDRAVVTGIRWATGNGRIFMEIQEGILVNGFVDPSTVHWLENRSDPDDDDILNVDYRSVSLDDIILPAGQFVTGVELRRSLLPRSDGKADTLTLRVWGSPVDKNKNIKMDQNLYGVNTTTIREEIILNDSDGSDNDQGNATNRVIREPGKHFVKFQPTSLEKDAGQTTIPYLDTQEIVTKPSAPISGIGMYYKGSKGFGGFIGLKLISADVTSLIDDKKSDGIFEELAAGALEEIRKKKV